MAKTPKQTFIVNWEIQGFRSKVHAIGAFIEAEAEEVKELVEQGAVSLWDKIKGEKVTVSATATVGDETPASEETGTEEKSNPGTPEPAPASTE